MRFSRRVRREWQTHVLIDLRKQEQSCDFLAEFCGALRVVTERMILGPEAAREWDSLIPRTRL